jgi:hypothetical protein
MAARFLLCACVLGVLVLAACGGDGADSGDDEARTPSPTGDLNEDEVAEAILLRVADFPSGWAETPSAEDDGDELEGCPTLQDSPDITGEAETGAFSRGGLASVSQRVAIFVDNESARAGASVIEERAQCIVDFTNDGGLDDNEATYGDATLGHVSFSGGSFEYTLALRVSITGTLREGDMQVATYFDLIYEVDGRVVSYLTAWETLTPFDTSLLERLSQTAADRIEDSEIPSLDK